MSKIMSSFAHLTKNNSVRTIRKWWTVSWRLRRRSLSRYTRGTKELPTKYGGITPVTVLPGYGIGSEIMACTLKILKAASAPLNYEIIDFPSTEYQAQDFENALISIRRNKVALKGNIEVKSKDPHIISRNIILRKTLDLYVYVIFCKTYPGLVNRFGDVDIIVIRQNTEGEYLMLEHEPIPGKVEILKVVTQFNCERLAEFAFKFAIANNRKKITVVHKADVEFYTEGIFLIAAEKVAKKYPQVKMNILEVGVAVFQMTKNPNLFDVILATNLNGSMVANFILGMCGGPGLIPGTNFSECGIAVFEPGARNKGSSIVGQGIANPVAMIMAGVNLLDYLGHNQTADVIRSSVFATLVQDKIRTVDLGGEATTDIFVDNVIKHISKKLNPAIKKGVRLDYRWKSHYVVSKKEYLETKDD